MKPSSTYKHLCPRTALVYFLLLLTLAPLGANTSWADKIITSQGQSLEGIIRDENDFYIQIDVKGIIIPVPHERIASITRNTLDENARMLLDRAFESLSRDDMSTARTLVEQARALNSQDATIMDNLKALDQEIADMERRGGTPEERRRRAESLLRLANDAFDKIRNEEGNQLLIQALRIDPTFEQAHHKIDELLTQTSRPDLMLAADYFVDVLWPDNMRTETPVIGLLPQTYLELANRFENTRDIRKAYRYADLMKVISESFVQQPTWLDKVEPATKELIQTPLPELLATLIEQNLALGDAEFALQKMRGWTEPMASDRIAQLYARAYIGTDELQSALDTLNTAAQTFPSNTSLATQANAVKLMIEARQAQDAGDIQGALAQYDRIFPNRAQLLPEIGQIAGQQLAKLRYASMEPSLASGPRWQGPDIACLVIAYSTEWEQRHRAAEILNSTIQTLPWSLHAQLAFNGNAVALPGAVVPMMQNVLSQPLAVRFEPESPFAINLSINAVVEGDEAVANAQKVLTDPQATLEAPVEVKELQFTLTATHPVLGRMLEEKWAVNQLPALVAQARQARGETITPQSPQISLTNAESLGAFVNLDLKDYMVQGVRYLPSQLSLPLMTQLLNQKSPQS